MVLGSYVIPEGTTVWPNLYALHHEPAYWSEPNTFMPERFLDESGSFKGNPPNLKPFGGGPRVCLGEREARNVLYVSSIFVVITLT